MDGYVIQPSAKVPADLCDLCELQGKVRDIRHDIVRDSSSSASNVYGVTSCCVMQYRLISRYDMSSCDILRS